MIERYPKLSFKPVHPLNFPYREIVSETELPSSLWPDLMRVISTYIDVHNDFCVMVCFRRKGWQGNMDLVRCYAATIRPSAKEANSLGAYGGPEIVADMAEEQLADTLSMFYGHPGEEQPAHWHAI